MYKQTTILLAAAFMFLASVGCTSVTTSSIVGTPSPDIAKNIQGVWKFEDALFFAKALDDGKLMFANVDWKTNQWKIGQRIATVTKAGEHKLLYMGTSKPADETDDSKPIANKPDEQYLFFKLVYNSDKPDGIVAYVPDPEVFAKAIAAGKLKGTVEHDDKNKVKSVVLKSNTEELEAFFKDTPAAELFHMQTPLILVRMK